MDHRIKLAIISILVALCSYGQSSEELALDLLGKTNIQQELFESSLEDFQPALSIPHDSLMVYKDWLLSEGKDLLPENNAFFKVHYYLELARVRGAIGEYEAAYRGIDSALAALDRDSLPGAYRGALNAATAMASEWTDYHAMIRYLELLRDSGTIDDDPIELGRVLTKLAQLYLGLHQYEESSLCAREALSVVRESGDQKSMVDLLIVMYHDSFHSNSDSTNMDYLYQAREIAHELGDSMAIATVYKNIGQSYYRDGDQEKAIEYYKLARSFVPGKGTMPEVYIAVFQMLSSLILEDADAAYELSLYVERQAREHGRLEYLSNAYRARADCYARWELTDSARTYLEKAHEERAKYSQKDEASPGFYYYLYETALMIKDYPAALKYLRISLSQHRRINRDYTAEDLNKTRAGFDYELQKERIDKLNLENELKRQSLARQRMIIAFIVVILLSMAFFLYLLRKQLMTLKGAYKDLVRKNLEIDRLNKSLNSCERRSAARRSGPDIRDEEKIYLKARKLFEKDKIYKQQDLTATSMAGRMGTNTTYLSNVVNKRFRQPFKSVVNKYRIDEARKLLVSEEYYNYSIEGIASEVGFQSRSVFYQVFKQQTGMTPSAYIEAYREIGAEV